MHHVVTLGPGQVLPIGTVVLDDAALQNLRSVLAPAVPDPLPGETAASYAARTAMTLSDQLPGDFMWDPWMLSPNDAPQPGVYGWWKDPAAQWAAPSGDGSQDLVVPLAAIFVAMFGLPTLEAANLPLYLQNVGQAFVVGGVGGGVSVSGLSGDVSRPAVSLQGVPERAWFVTVMSAANLAYSGSAGLGMSDEDLDAFMANLLGALAQLYPSP